MDVYRATSQQTGTNLSLKFFPSPTATVSPTTKTVLAWSKQNLTPNHSIPDHNLQIVHDC